MPRELFKPWRHGKCESHLFPRLRAYCDKRARWYMTVNGYLLCGEHKKEIERAAQEV